MSLLISLSALFPRTGIGCGCRKSLVLLGADPGRYACMAIFLPAALAFLALFFIPPPAALLVFAAGAALILAAPGMEMRRRAAELESAMPFFLRSLGMLIELGIPFARAAELASKGEGRLGQEMERALSEAAMGMSLQRALGAFASSSGSITIKRAVSQMLSVYESGGSGAEMRKIGDEMLSLEQHRLKEYSSRMAMSGLLFIISSAVLPTFFLVYASAGSFGLGQPMGPGQVALALLVVFPLLSLSILLLSRVTMPGSALSGRRRMDLRFLAPAGMFCSGFLLPPPFGLPATAAGLALGAYMVHGAYRAGRRAESIEENLPDALFSVSGLPRSCGAGRLLRAIEEGGFGALSEEAGAARKQVEMNLSSSAALADLSSRNGSVMLERACLMLGQMLDLGSLDRMSMLAEDIIRTFQTMRERSQLFSMQKYTLMAGALIIPLIMKMTVHLMEGMEGLSAGGPSGALAAAALVPPYIVIYSAISSLAIAEAEGKGSAVAVYSIGLSVLGLLAFRFINL